MRVDGGTVYEWLPTTIVAGTFLIGVFAEALEARRIPWVAPRTR